MRRRCLVTDVHRPCISVAMLQESLGSQSYIELDGDEV